MVWPTISGKIVERRDQVLMTRLSPFVLRVHLLHQVVVDEGALLQAAWHGQRLRFLPRRRMMYLSEAALPLAGAALRVAPRVDRVATAGGLALTTTQRVVDGFITTPRVWGRLPFQRASGLAERDELVLLVADRADGGAAARVDQPDLAGGHAQRGVLALLGQQLDRGARRPTELRATPGPQLDGVDRGTDRDVGSGRALPTLMSACGPDSTSCPTTRLRGARM
jgi:hypothetical protein